MRPNSALAAHRFLLRAAAVGANVFAWIFVFQYMYALSGNAETALLRTTFLYALSQTILCLATPYAASNLRNGIRRNLLFGTLFAAAAFIFLGGAFNGFFGSAESLGIGGFAIFLGLYQALYWVPYTLESRAYPIPYHASNLSELLLALMPALSGALLGLLLLSPSWLLLGAGILALLAIIPIAFVPDVHEGFSWGYRETFAHLAAGENRRQLWTSLIQGVETAALLLLWPIALIAVLGFSYKVVGVVLSITLLVSIILRSSIAALMQRYNIHASPYVLATVAVSAWIGRLLVVSPTGVVLLDSYLLTGAQNRPSVSPTHFFQNVEATYLDEHTVLKEMGLALGRILLCLIAAFFAYTFSITFAFITCFILVAIAAGSGVFLHRRSRSRVGV